MTDIGAKVAHVRAAIAEGDAGKHHCHWPGCDKAVPPAAWGCLAHWRKLPKDIQRAIWRAYRLGQEDRKNPSVFYIDAARRAQAWIMENHPPKPKPQKTQGELL